MSTAFKDRPAAVDAADRESTQDNPIRALEGSLHSIDFLLRIASHERQRSAAQSSLAQAQRELVLAQVRLVSAHRQQARLEERIAQLERLLETASRT